jgi:hypothetical protein
VPVHRWFDAFRTMMFLHALRERGWPDLPHREALKRADFLGKRSAPEPLACLTQLDRERGTGVLCSAAGGPVG